MRSRLTAGTPAARRVATAASTLAASWTRPRAASTRSSKLWAPIETLATPAPTSPAAIAASTVSGLASTVTSAPGATGSSSRSRASTRARSSAGSRVGVPPPTNTLVTTGGPGPGGATPPGAPRHGPLLQQRGRIRPPQPLHPGVGDEVAVVTAGQAERHMHVHPEAGRIDQWRRPQSGPRRGGLHRPGPGRTPPEGGRSRPGTGVLLAVRRGRGDAEGGRHPWLSSVRRAATNAS